jgi:phosphohistidine phosphatase
MLLYLLRHAEAEDLAASDAARRLTAKGEAQAKLVGKFCREHDLSPSVILTSPVTRAKQTAEIVQRELAKPDLMEVPWAACGMDPWDAMDQLGAMKKIPAVMLVGHQPDLAGLAGALLGLTTVTSLHVRKALLLGIEVPHGLKTGGGILQFFLPPKLM